MFKFVYLYLLTWQWVRNRFGEVALVFLLWFWFLISYSVSLPCYLQHFGTKAAMSTGIATFWSSNSIRDAMCSHTFAIHSAVSNKLFMHIRAQLCSAVKNCDVHVLLQHLCDAMRSHACNALCCCQQAIYAYNGTTAQCSEGLWHTLLLQHPCNAGCSHTCNTQGCFEQPVCLWPHIRMLQPKLHSSASRVVVMLLLRSGSASKSQRVRCVSVLAYSYSIYVSLAPHEKQSAQENLVSAIAKFGFITPIFQPDDWKKQHPWPCSAVMEAFNVVESTIFRCAVSTSFFCFLLLLLFLTPLPRACVFRVIHALLTTKSLFSPLCTRSMTTLSCVLDMLGVSIHNWKFWLHVSCSWKFLLLNLFVVFWQTVNQPKPNCPVLICLFCWYFQSICPEGEQVCE